MILSLRIYLIRHGETEWSRSGQYTGRTDLPLTARGEVMARELGQLLCDIPFSRVLTSPLQRARRTCELAGLSVAATIEPDLAEWNYGDYEGQHSAAVHEVHPDWNLFRDGCPRGETPMEVSARADRLIAKLRTLDGNVGLFSHGHFGRALAARWIGLPIAEACHFLLGTASLSVLAYEHERIDSPAIARWNVGPGDFPAATEREIPPKPIHS